MEETKAPQETPRYKNLRPPWKPGESGNPGGKPRGTRNFETDFFEAAKEVAEALGLGQDPDKIKVQLVKRGIREGLAGEFSFWDKLMERLYGKPEETIKLGADETLKRVTIEIVKPKENVKENLQKDKAAVE